TPEKAQTSPNALVLQSFRGAQGRNRTADTGIFNPAGSGIVDRENKHVGADRDADWDANGDLTSEPRPASPGTPLAPRAASLQPGGGLDEPGTSSEQPAGCGGFRASRPAEGSAEPGSYLHPVAL